MNQEPIASHETGWTFEWFPWVLMDSFALKRGLWTAARNGQDFFDELSVIPADWSDPKLLEALKREARLRLSLKLYLYSTGL